MKTLSFHYHLKISMDAPVSRHHFTLRCTPASDERQRITQVQHYIFPSVSLSSSRDQWNNILVYGHHRGLHSSFEANVCGRAVTGMASGTRSPKPERDMIFQYATQLTAADDALREFAGRLGIRSGAPEEAEALMHAVYETLSYKPASTTISTSAAEAFALGCGVCQDYSHIMIAVCRAAGIPARYAAGMMLGEGQSHAWVEVLHEGIWTGYDPTNDLVVSDQHIKMSHGRDARDCSINRGIFFGYGSQTTEISVIVTDAQEGMAFIPEEEEPR
ncbi:MAG: transglutaminase family protein [Stomatobaculum sp.]|nr:transglutaminase family protein [Stomatobaculum sp.]